MKKILAVLFLMSANLINAEWRRFAEIGGGLRPEIFVSFSPDSESLLTKGWLSGSDSILIRKFTDSGLLPAQILADASSRVLFSPSGLRYVVDKRDGDIEITSEDGKRIKVPSSYDMNDSAYLFDRIDDTRVFLITDNLWVFLNVTYSGYKLTFVGTRGEILKKIKEDGLGFPSNISVSPNGNFLAVTISDYSERINLWRLLDYELYQTIYPSRGGTIGCLDFSQDSKYLAIGGEQGVELFEFDGEGYKLKSRSNHDNQVDGLAFSSEGNFLMVNYSTGCSVLKVPSLEKCWDSIYPAVFSSSGFIAVFEENDEGIDIINVATLNDREHLPESKGLWPVAFSPDGNFLLVEGSGGFVLYRNE